MNILFISSGVEDYQCDMVFHGLSNIEGVRVTDINKMSAMYKPLLQATGPQLYGKGFTMYGLLHEDPGVSRINIRSRIAKREFDFVIYGSIHRTSMHLSAVLTHYRPEEIAFIDGEDHQVIWKSLVGRGVYFKRELSDSAHEQVPKEVANWLKPINFAIPAEKIWLYTCRKEKLMAFIDPLDRKTYIYESEKAYYEDYATSLFGITTKKAGWDCLRHYEIMANACIPYFTDLRACPSNTLTGLPKSLLLEVNKVILQKGLEFFETPEGREVWAAFQKKIADNLAANLTTKALATSTLDTCRSMKSEEWQRSRLLSRSIAAAKSGLLTAINSSGQRTGLAVRLQGLLPL